MDPVIPAAFEEIIARLDQNGTAIDEHEVKQALVAARKSLADPGEAENLGAWAEVLAFALVAHRTHPSPWNTYFGPMASGMKEDGEPFYSPDIAGTDPEVIAHWTHRAQTIKHPILKARYADLVWDMSRAIAKTKAHADMARMACDAYLASLAQGLRRNIHHEFETSIRALDLAAMLRDTDRIDTARAALLKLHRKAIERGKGLWWKAFDRLIDDKNARLTEQERDQLFFDLETLTVQFSNTADLRVFDPHATQSAAGRLIAQYNKLKNPEDAARLHQTVAQSFEHAASLADPMLASALLETSVSAYRAARLHDESKRVRVLMEDRIAASAAEMKTFTFETTITKDDMEKFLAYVVVDDIGLTFAKIASEFVESRARLEAQVNKLLEDSPLMAIMTHTVMAEKHVAAKVGPVEDDPFGRVIQQSAQSIAFVDFWLTAALDRAIDVHGLTPHHFVGWAARSRLFEDLNLLMEGITAWFARDFVKTIHVLIPQVESALRSIAGKLGKPTTKAHPKIAGVSVAVSMGDLLYSEELAEAMGADITLHLLTVFVDPRGFNLRNDMAHGLLAAGQLGANVASRLIHTLLVLGVWDQIAQARRSQVHSTS